MEKDSDAFLEALLGGNLKEIRRARERVDAHIWREKDLGKLQRAVDLGNCHLLMEAAWSRTCSIDLVRDIFQEIFGASTRVDTIKEMVEAVEVKLRFMHKS